MTETTETVEPTNPTTCGKECDHGSPCLLPHGHEPADRHETQHGCIFYDDAPKPAAHAFNAVEAGYTPCGRAPIMTIGPYLRVPPQVIPIPGVRPQ